MMGELVRSRDETIVMTINFQKLANSSNTHVEALVLIDINGTNILILNTRGRIVIALINGKIFVKEIINLTDSDM